MTSSSARPHPLQRDSPAVAKANAERYREAMSSTSDEKLSHSEASPVAEVSYDAELTKSTVDRAKLLRKLDLRLLPIVSALYLLSFLDRTNIGNAKVAGLTADLHLTGLQYNLCAALFFIPYCFFEVPSNLTMKAVNPSRWIPVIMFCWGAVMVSMAFVKNFAGLATARVFLGMTEAGLFPGVTFYLCIWYPRAAQAQRFGLFLSAATAAGAFGGLLAFAIEKMNGIGGLAGWSWIFLIEGLITSAVAVLAYFTMYDYPENASFLNEDERTWLIETLKNDTTGLSKTFKWTFFWQAIKDPHTYLIIAIYFFVLIPSYALALFLPTIIAGLGFSSSHAQLLSVPPNAAGCVVTITFGILSDRFRARGPFIVISASLALIGYVILYATSSPHAGYAGTIVAASGLFPSVAVMLAWGGGNVGGEVKRAVVIAMLIGFGNLGGIPASFIYRAQDSPRYHPGHATAIACLCAAILLCFVGMVEYTRLNRKKEAQCAREGITPDRAEEFVDLGDSSPLFRTKH
ncbi:MFS general substrate transporter [Trametes elegans]|nr:MFS general substrate transporter [Trametes elegans]